MQSNKKNWGVVGGGVLGMKVAMQLAKEGYKVTLYESAPVIGGLASAWQIDEVVWDKFYHVILLSDSYTRDLIKEIGLEDKARWVETKTGFYTGGKLYSMSNSFEFLKFPPLSIIDKLRLGFTIFYASKIRDWKKLEKVYVADWLKKLSGKNTFKKMWLPLLRSKLGEHYTDTSAAFIWATIQRMYAARNSGLKKEMFGYIDGGYATILQAFEKRLIDLGVEIKTGARLQKLKSGQNSIDASFDGGFQASHDRVILTIPSAFVPGSVDQMPETEQVKHKGIRYLGVVCTSVLMDKPISPYYVTNITDEGAPFTGVIEMTALVDKDQLGGRHLIYLPKYVAPNDPIFDEADEVIEKRFLDAIFQMYPHISKEHIVAVKTARAKNVFALSTIGYSEHLPPKKSAVPGVYVVNSAHITNGTLNVNESLKLAGDAVNEILNTN
ncbi:MAG: NAD(P)/FAD-dependent oxidoreductase [Bacteroidales bacterium]